MTSREGESGKPSDGFSFQDWYKANGETLNKTRRNRYNTDPEYRERVLARNNESRQKRKKDAGVERAAEAQAKQVRKTPGWKTVEVMIKQGRKKVKALLCTIGALAKATGYSIKTLRLWEKKGMLPSTPHQSEKGDRLYTPEQVELFVAQLKAEGKLSSGKVVVRKRRSHIEGRVRLSDGTLHNVVLFRVGRLAKVVGRSVTSIESLEAKGYLPITPFRASSVGQRLYTEDMIKAVKKAFDSRAGKVRGVEAWGEFRDEVVAAWKAQLVFGAELIQGVDKEREDVSGEAEGASEALASAGAASDQEDPAGG